MSATDVSILARARMKLSIVDIVNYSVRLGIVVLGLFFVFGNVMPVPGDPEFTTYVGIAFIVFGCYRVGLYYIKSKQDKVENETVSLLNDNEKDS